ncbi:hypothetical protein MUK42_21198 [Musa troglodytarum]|uniref:Uncharacterized protein n=1 Tax=Musa troglodytarum TaxID=320322 RepID=A0A9E7KBS4_9LILI|nr:hypothetical protein MUK42_21198 [Musa troglodytarum]
MFECPPRLSPITVEVENCFGRFYTATFRVSDLRRRVVASSFTQIRKREREREIGAVGDVEVVDFEPDADDLMDKEVGLGPSPAPIAGNGSSTALGPRKTKGRGLPESELRISIPTSPMAVPILNGASLKKTLPDLSWPFCF